MPCVSTVVCGDGLVQTGEQCEVPGRLCVDCRITYWASCRYSGDTEPAPCGSYAGADRTRCETLLECVVRNDNVNVCGGANFGNTCVRPAYSASLTGCFCSDDACTKGADGDCAAAFQVAAGSTDLAEVRRQLVTSGTMVNKVATWVARAYCDERCSKYMGGVMIPSGATVGGNWVVVNEVDFDQVGADTREFIELFNGTGGPYDFSREDLVVFNTQGKRVLTVPLDGIVQNGGYLVVGSAAVTVPAGVKKIDLPGTADAIPNDSKLYITTVPRGGPDPANVTTAYIEFRDSDTMEGSTCVLPNGAVNVGGQSNILPTCATPTPGARNVQ